MSRVSWPFIGEVAPIWFRASLEEMAEVWEVYQQRQRDWFGAHTLRPASFPDLGEALDQVTFVPGTGLLVATRTPWTAVYYHPAEPAVFSWGLANYIPCAWATVELGASDVPGGGEDRQFMYHRVPRNRDEIVNSPKYCQRTVSLTRENSRWSFYHLGEPLPFEQLKAYTKSRRSDRLTTQMLLDYAAELDIPIDDMGAYGGETLLVYRPEYDKYPGLSLARKERVDFDELCLKRIEERLDAR